MVYQGTVFGPGLWNPYYADARKVIAQAGYQEVVCADDLNAFKHFDSSHVDHQLFDSLNSCQSKLHEWGRAN
eukprot:591711-Pyramimonas_sp.AAC.1